LSVEATTKLFQLSERLRETQSELFVKLFAVCILQHVVVVRDWANIITQLSVTRLS